MRKRENPITQENIIKQENAIKQENFIKRSMLYDEAQRRMQELKRIKRVKEVTILSIRDRRVRYWEHRGMMDDKDYVKSSVLRMKTLMHNGIFLGRDLIITEETSTNPLGTDEINTIIKEYFLDPT